MLPINIQPKLRIIIIIGVLASLLLGSPFFAQSISPTQTTSSALTEIEEDFQADRQEMVQEWMALTTPEQQASWQQQNAPELAQIASEGQILSDASYFQTNSFITDVDIPADASPTLTDYLTRRAEIANAQTEIHAQMVQSLGANGPELAFSTAGQQQINQAQQAESDTFSAQYGTQLMALREEAQTVAQEAGQKSTGEITPSLDPQIPPDSSPQMQAYLTLRYQLINEQTAEMNRYAGATAGEQAAALQVWLQQNAARFKQLQNLALALPPPN